MAAATIAFCWRCCRRSSVGPSRPGLECRTGWEIEWIGCNCSNHGVPWSMIYAGLGGGLTHPVLQSRPAHDFNSSSSSSGSTGATTAGAIDPRRFTSG